MANVWKSTSCKKKKKKKKAPCNKLFSVLNIEVYNAENIENEKRLSWCLYFAGRAFLGKTTYLELDPIAMKGLFSIICIILTDYHECSMTNKKKSSNYMKCNLPHKVKVYYVHLRLHVPYFCLPWKISEEISRRSVILNNLMQYLPFIKLYVHTIGVDWPEIAWLMEVSTFNICTYCIFTWYGRNEIVFTWQN